MADQEPTDAKTLTTAEAAHELGLQPDDFRTLAFSVGLRPGSKGQRHAWSDADVEVVRGLLEARS